MGLCDDVRSHCADIASGARFVSIDLDRLGEIEPGPPPALDPARHYVEGSREDVAAYFMTLDTINFGSGWFPTVRKRPGCSGYYTIAWGLADRFRANGPWTCDELRVMDAATLAAVFDQDDGHELMGLYATALRQLGDFLGERQPIDLIGGSAEALAGQLAAGMTFFDDWGFWKRAQITANDLQLAGVSDFRDIDRLTIFADNLVPHVLHVDGVLRYHRDLERRIDSGELLAPGDQEREIRGCAVHACELIATELGVPPRILDVWLWNRGQGERYKSRPRHRTRTVYY